MEKVDLGPATSGPFILKDPCPHCGHTTRDDAVIKRLGEQINQTITIPDGWRLADKLTAALAAQREEAK